MNNRKVVNFESVFEFFFVNFESVFECFFSRDHLLVLRELKRLDFVAKNLQ